MKECVRFTVMKKKKIKSFQIKAITEPSHKIQIYQSVVSPEATLENS